MGGWSTGVKTSDELYKHMHEFYNVRLITHCVPSRGVWKSGLVVLIVMAMFLADHVMTGVEEDFSFTLWKKYKF